MIVLRIICDANGRPTMHDGRFVQWYNPHTPFGTLAMESTDNLKNAKVFKDHLTLHAFLTQISCVQPVRPDGKPNRPISGLTIDVLPLRLAEETPPWKL